MLFLKGPKAAARFLAFSPNGRFLASAGERDKVISVWDGCSGQLRGSLEGHPAPVTALAFAQVTGLLASTDRAGHVRTWEPISCNPHSAPAVPGGFCLTFSSDGRWLAVGQCQRRGYAIQLLDMGSEAVGSVLQGQDQVIYCMAFSPDGQTLACGTEDGVNLWDATSGAFRTQLRRLTIVRAAAYTPGGDELAFAEARGVTLWDTTTGSTRSFLQGQEGLVTSVAFGPGGRLLLSGAWGGTVRVWDVRTGRNLTAYEWGIGQVYAVAISSDGMRAAAAGPQGIVIWDLDDLDP
jgi:WD40 repeat protein